MDTASTIVGIVGNVISVLVFASPITTFTRIVKKKSTMNYAWLPYVTTLLNTSLWTYYGLLKPNGLLLVTVNGAGSVMQAVYVMIFLIYAPTSTRVTMAKLTGGLNIGLYGVVILVTLLAFHGSLRLLIVGCFCAAITVGMYTAPMAAMRLIVQTKSVEFMPFSLSFFLFLNGGVWSVYAYLVRDFFIGVPNAIGFILGTAQLILYAIYRRKSPPSKESEVSEAKCGAAADPVIIRQLEIIATNTDKSVYIGRSLPSVIKRSMSRQTSLINIVKSLSLPPYGNSNWSLDEPLESEDPC